MQENPLIKLTSLGQSIWLDFISRQLIDSGELKRLIDADGLRGMTSNPAIFDKAISGSRDYDEAIRKLAREGKGIQEICEALTVADVQRAADVFRPLHDQMQGADGFVSLEVNPHLAHDTPGTIAEARRLWGKLDRPNVFIKVPATLEGLPAIRQLIGAGVNVNITLLFGLPRYREVAEAYLAGLEARAAKGLDLTVASVASFFLSRIDVLLDSQLEDMAKSGSPLAPAAAALTGEVAIASAKVAYSIYQRNLRQRPLPDPGPERGPDPAPALGQHQHQEPGLPRPQVRGAPHRAGDHQYLARGDPQRLPGPWPAGGDPPGGTGESRRCPAAPAGVGYRPQPGDPTVGRRRGGEIQPALRQPGAHPGR